MGYRIGDAWDDGDYTYLLSDKHKKRAGKRTLTIYHIIVSGDNRFSVAHWTKDVLDDILYAPRAIQISEGVWRTA